MAVGPAGRPRHRRMDAHLPARGTAAKCRSATPTAWSRSKAWSGSTVDVRAERIAHADDRRRRARAAAAHRDQEKTSRPTASSIQTERIERHHDSARIRGALPRAARRRMRSCGPRRPTAEIDVAALSGKLTAADDQRRRQREGSDRRRRGPDDQRRVESDSRRSAPTRSTCDDERQRFADVAGERQGGSGRVGHQRRHQRHRPEVRGDGRQSRRRVAGRHQRRRHADRAATSTTNGADPDLETP